MKRWVRGQGWMNEGDIITFVDTGIVCKIVKVHFDGSVELERVE